jgi:hypothetical protein
MAECNDVFWMNYDFVARESNSPQKVKNVPQASQRVKRENKEVF